MGVYGGGDKLLAKFPILPILTKDFQISGTIDNL
jgi:hypothetical protein